MTQGRVVPLTQLLPAAINAASATGATQLVLDLQATLEHLVSFALKSRYVLKVVYRVIPPTSNLIYFQGTKLTNQARKYAEDFSTFCVRNHMAEQMYFAPDRLYAVHVRFFFETVENKTWNDMTKKKKDRAKERYKKFDLDNRIKLLTDCIRDFIGVDDSHVFAGSQEKHQDPQDPRIEIYVHEVDPLMFGVVDP